MDAAELFKHLLEKGRWDEVANTDEVLFTQAELGHGTYVVLIRSTMGQDGIYFRVQTYNGALTKKQIECTSAYVSGQQSGEPRPGVIFVGLEGLLYEYTWIIPLTRKLSVFELEREIESIADLLLWEFDEHSGIVQKLIRGEITTEMATRLKDGLVGSA